MNNNNKSQVIISTDMSIGCIEELREELMKELNVTQKLSITVEKIDQLDITGIQLLYALNKEASLQGKKIQWNIVLNSEQQKRIELAGFDKIVNNEI